MREWFSFLSVQSSHNPREALAISVNPLTAGQRGFVPPRPFPDNLPIILHSRQPHFIIHLPADYVPETVLLLNCVLPVGDFPVGAALYPVGIANIPLYQRKSFTDRDDERYGGMRYEH